MQYTIDEVEEIITGAGIPFGRIQNTKEATESELIKSRNMIWEYYDPAFGKEIKYPGCPIKVHGTEDKVRKPAPQLGEDNVKLLGDLLGMSEEEVHALEEKGVM